MSFKKRWEIKGGTTKLDGCDSAVISVDCSNSNTHPTVCIESNEESWSQSWEIIAHNTVILTENVSPTQE